jgi:hypothetical protein
MGTSLLDFVMALVRDPQAAARYAADPVGALADAQLPGVTIADVANLIPVVTDSLAMTSADFGAVADVGNVWTSNAAAAAFDAFDVVHHPAPAHPAEPAVNVIPTGDAAQDPDMTHIEPAAETFATDPNVEQPPADIPVHDWADDGGWQQADHPHVAEHHPAEHPGFDLF